MDVPVYSLKNILLKAREGYQVYYTTDTHWNQMGSYHAYVDMVEKLRSAKLDIQPLSLSEFKIETIDIPGGGLAGMIGERHNLRDKDTVLTLISAATYPKIPLKNYLGDEWPADWKQPYRIDNGSVQKKLLVIGDSFFLNDKSMVPILFSQHFRQSIYLHRDEISQKQFEQVIQIENPDVVIEEVVERNLFKMPK